MKLKKEFDDFYGQICIDKEAEALKDKREILEDDIKNELPDILGEHDISLNKSDIRMIDQGSYKYHTTIKSDVVDRDVAVIIPLDIDEHSDPREIKKYLKDAITIPMRTVAIKEPCVRASYYEDGKERLHVDLPLYADHNGSLYLARGKEYSETYSWENADPDGLNDALCNTINGNAQLRRIIRYIKKWKNEAYVNPKSDHEMPPSIGLTLLACDYFIPAIEDGKDYDLLSLKNRLKQIQGRFSITFDGYYNVIGADIQRYLTVKPYTDVFDKMRSSSEQYMLTFYKRLSAAVSNLEDAVNTSSDHDAALSVQKVLGEDFEVPEDTSVKSATILTMSKREHGFG